MSTEENLTYLQKVALKGEIGFALSTSTHDTEMKYRIYFMLKEVDNKFKPLIVECAKEAVTFDESIIDRIYLEILNESVPVWLWIEEIIADIKLYLSSVEKSYVGLPSDHLSINKLQERKNLIESAFILFAREAIIVSPKAATQLFESILNDYDLEFLHKACFYLKNDCSEIYSIKGDKIPEQLMSCLFNIRKILNFSIETQVFEALNKTNESHNNESSMQPSKSSYNNEVIVQGKFTIDRDMLYNHEEFSNYISNEITKLLEESISSNNSSNNVYIVRKVFTDSGLSTDIRTCNTEEEAINFIKKIVREYPELTNVCEFRVCAENKENYEKNKWVSQNSKRNGNVVQKPDRRES